MYNRYIPNGTTYTRVVENDAPPSQPGPPPEQPERNAGPEAKKAGKKKSSGGLAGLLKSLKLEDLDTGDILLLLILLFLFLDGEDSLELIITLGLLLVMGLD